MWPISLLNRQRLACQAYKSAIDCRGDHVKRLIVQIARIGRAQLPSLCTPSAVPLANPPALSQTTNARTCSGCGSQRELSRSFLLSSHTAAGSSGWQEAKISTVRKAAEYTLPLPRHLRSRTSIIDQPGAKSNGKVADPALLHNQSNTITDKEDGCTNWGPLSRTVEPRPQRGARQGSSLIKLIPDQQWGSLTTATAGRATNCSCCASIAAQTRPLPSPHLAIWHSPFQAAY